MKYTRLILSDKKLTRENFLDQPRKLFILPDNLPDFRLPRNKLYDSQHRGGLAECMRPNLIGGTARHPIYDVNIVGVPTLSYDKNEGLSIKHIAEAFANIYRLINTGDFDEIVVPYKDNQPAFGGGVAGAIPALIKNSIDEECNRLEAFLQNKVMPSDFPEDLRKAYVEGPLAIKSTMRERFNAFLNDRFPRVALVMQTTLAFGSAWGIYAALASSLSLTPLIVAMATSSAISVGLYQLVTRGLFGQERISFGFNKDGHVLPKSMSWASGALRFIGIKAPYKPTITDMESDLKKALGTFFKQQPGQLDATYNDELATLAKYNTKKIILSNADSFFYEADIQRVKSKDYDVDAQVAEYRRKRNA